MEKYYMTVQELSQFLNIGRCGAYAMCHEPGFPITRYGRKILINRQRLIEWLEAQEAKKREVVEK